MKLNVNFKNVKADLEANIENLVDKGMEQYDRTWKDKFNTKHTAKKEMLEIKHKHKMDIEENNKNKKNWIQKIQEEKLKMKELELAEQRRREEEKKKVIKIKTIISIILGMFGLTLMIIGSILGSESGDPNSGWYAMSVLGFFPLLAAGFIWIDFSDNKKK